MSRALPENSQFLDSTLASSTPLAQFGCSAFYPSARSYHLFHTCHQYASRALQAVGLPLTPALAFKPDHAMVAIEQPFAAIPRSFFHFKLSLWSSLTP
jgi:hypothetical protein